jgi:hypothetical protein
MEYQKIASVQTRLIRKIRIQIWASAPYEVRNSKENSYHCRSKILNKTLNNHFSNEQERQTSCQKASQSGFTYESQKESRNHTITKQEKVKVIFHESSSSTLPHRRVFHSLSPSR